MRLWGMASTVAVVVSTHGCASRPTEEVHDAGVPIAPCGPLEAPTSDGTCVSSAIEKCGNGFRNVDGACEAVLPAEPCAAGTMALPGDSACKPVAPCGSDPFGEVPSGTVSFVDAAAAPSGDGTRDRPFNTISAALAAATTDNPAIAVAAGTYEEDVLFTRPARLFGRCPELVEIKGTGSAPAVDGKVAFELHRLSITGPYIGVRAYDSDGVRIEEVRVHDTGERAFDLESGSRPSVVALHRVLVESPTYLGIAVLGATATIDDVVVRDVRLRSGGSGGFGLQATVHSSSGIAPKLDVRHTVVERAKQAAIAGYGADVTVRDVLIKDAGLAKGTGFGIFHAPFPDSGACGALDVDGVVIDGARYSGIAVRGCTARIADTVVRNVTTDAKGAQGQGIQLSGCKGELERVLVEDVQHVGLVVEGSTATARNIVVRRVTPAPAVPFFGGGIAALQSEPGDETSLSLFGAVVSDVHTSGIFAIGATITVDGAHVHDILPAADDGRFGDAFDATALPGSPIAAGRLSVQHGRVERVARAGIYSMGSEVTIASTSVLCTAFPLELSPDFEGGTRDPTLEDGGGNRCVDCAGVESSCRAQTSDLAPVKALSPL